MVRVVDTTLREGEQTPGVYLPRHVKLAIADQLDRVGVDIIESGHPEVDPEVHEAVRSLAGRSLKAQVGAHARSRISDVDAALGCGVDFLGVFYCVSNERLAGVFRRSVPEAAQHVAEVVRHARSASPDLEIRYTPEDSVRSPFENVLEVSLAAVEAGADVISVADTTGLMVPGSRHDMYEYVSRLREALAARGAEPTIGVHCHNDRGLALANALDGVRAGAEIVDATVLGLGERAGIVDLASLVLALHERGEERFDLLRLKELYEYVSAHTGIPIPVNQPIVGRNAFTHCAGVHTQAALLDPLHYQSLDPALFGRQSSFCLDHMSGVAAVMHGLEEAGLESNRELATALLQEVKAVGRLGRRVQVDELPYMVDSITAVGRS